MTLKHLYRVEQERQLIREKLANRFTTELTSSQLSLNISPAFLRLGQSEMKHKLLHYVYGSLEFLHLLQFVLAHSEEDRRLFFDWIDSLPLDECPTKNLPELIKKKYLSDQPRIEFNRKTDFLGMHFTEPNRFADSDLFLSTYTDLPDRIRTNGNCLFIGGSYGITAAEFRIQVAQTTNCIPHVTVLDLYSPEEIQMRFAPNSATELKYSFLNYLKADILSDPLRSSQYSFIDSSNCLGYLNVFNDRLMALDISWSYLEIGGYLRLTTPTYESLFEQMIFRKIGESIFAAELVYVGFRGKTASIYFPHMSTPEEICKSNMNLTRLVKKVAKYATNVSQDDELFASLVLRDIQSISPASFGAGIYDHALAHIYQYECESMAQWGAMREAKINQALAALDK